MERDPYTMSPRELSREVLSEVADDDRESRRSLDDAERDVRRLLRERAEIESLAEKQMEKAGSPGVEELRARHTDLGEQLNWALSRKVHARVGRESLDSQAQAARDAERAADRHVDAERREIARGGLETRLALRAHQREAREAESRSRAGNRNTWTQSGRLSETFESERAREDKGDRER